MRNVFEGASAISKGLGNALGNIVETGSLPAIRGKWYFVDPTAGDDNASGVSLGHPLDSISEAYERAVDGDGIALISYGSTSAATTSYLKTGLTWAKNGITVFGVCSPTHISPRSRIANKKITTTAAQTVTAGALKIITRATGSYITDGWEVGMTALTAGDQTVSSVVTAVSALSLTVTDDLTESAAGITSVTSTVVDLITISGSNNRFYNVSFWNGGSSTTEIGGVTITGERNYLYGCHIVGSAGYASANAKSLYINAGEENLFENCTIGTDTIDRGDNACSEILIAGISNRNRFKDCEILFRIDSGTAAAGIKSSATTSSSGAAFDNCIFNATFGAATPADVHLVATNAADIVTLNCACYNFTGWGAQVYVNGAASAASAAGSIATTE